MSDPTEPARDPNLTDQGPAEPRSRNQAEAATVPSNEALAEPEHGSAPTDRSLQPWYRRKSTVLIAGVSAAALVLGGSSITGVAITASVVRSAFDESSNQLRYDATENDRNDNLETRTPTMEPATASTATASTPSEQVGVVTILTTIGYSHSAEAAGTGMVMTADGLILTNNHVIDGSTSISVTIESTGQTYSATVVGADAVQDVAVLQLQNASALTPVQFDTDDTASVGESVYSVGNADGTGDLVTANGVVTGTNQSITVEGENSQASETLQGLIEVDSDVVAGDSGGPLLDDEGDVIGIITAASTSSTTSIVGYAIDIDAALAVASQIASGTETATVQIGETPFLGVELPTSATSPSATGVPIGGVLAGMPAAAAGLAAGDTITAIDGITLATPNELSDAVAAHNVGDTIAISWTDTAGDSHNATTVLVAGPA